MGRPPRRSPLRAQSPTGSTDSVAAGAIDDAGRSTLALTVREAKRSRAALAFGAPGQVPEGLTRVGPTDAYDLDLATNAGGISALTFSVGSRAYLTVCNRGACGATARVGTAADKPESVVAVQPGSGRVTVMWRGQGRSGTRRLRWRITTGGKLGRTHTLGELGDRPRIGTDRSGKTVAIWQDRKDRSLRTAARRVGEFTRPAQVTSHPVTGQQLAVGAQGLFLAGWISRSTPIDEQSPMGTAQTARRGDGTNFSAPSDHGEATAVGVAVSSVGGALLSVLGPGGQAPISAATSNAGGASGRSSRSRSAASSRASSRRPSRSTIRATPSSPSADSRPPGSRRRSPWSGRSTGSSAHRRR